MVHRVVGQNRVVGFFLSDYLSISRKIAYKNGGNPKKRGIFAGEYGGRIGDAIRRAYRSPSEYFGAKLTKNYAGDFGTLVGEPAKDRPLDAYR